MVVAGYRVLWALCLLLATGLVGCEPAARTALTETPSQAAVELIDALDKPVRYPTAPSRIVPMTSTLAGYVLALGAGGRLAAVASGAHTHDTLYQLPQVPIAGAVDLAALRATRPDALLATPTTFTEELRLVGSELNAPVLFLPAGTVAAAPSALRLLGPVLGRPAAAARLADSLAAATDVVRARYYPDTTLTGPTVLVLIGENPVQGLTAATFTGDAVAALGGRNVLDARLGRFPTLTTNDLAQLEPEVIILLGTDRDYPRRLLDAHPVLRTTPALEKGRFYIADPALVLEASMRTTDALDLLGQFLWPEKAPQQAQ